MFPARLAVLYLLLGLFPIAAGQSPAAVAPPDLEAIYLHLSYQMGFGGAVYPTYEPHILFKDGSITDDWNEPPAAAADLPAWKKRNPRAWGRWTKSGNTMSIRWDDPRRKPETWEKWFVARPGTPGLRLDGRYQSLSGGGNTALGGDVASVAWRGYELRADGTVTSSGGAGLSSGGSGTGVSVVTGARRPQQQGTYRIEGYTIQFDFGGNASRAWFFLYPDSDRVIGIGGSTYTLKKPK